MFPPLTGLEFLHHRVEDGHILIVAVRPSVNLSSLTIEKVIAKMQTSHVQLLDLLTDGLRFVGVPPKALQPLSSLRQRATQRDAAWYNATNNYRDATNHALDAQTKCFRDLTSTDMVTTLKEMGEKRMKATALVAARAGQHEIAVELLLRRRMFKVEELGSSPEPTVSALTEVARELLLSGCMQPWPQTLVALAGQKTTSGGLKNECLPPEVFRKLVEEALAESSKKPFHKGASVLVCLDLKKMYWTQARMRSSEPIRRPPVLKKDGSVKLSGVAYDVEVSGEVNTYPEEQVVHPEQHGVSAVLCVAAEKGDPTLVQQLLEAKVNVYATDLRASTALIRVVEGQQINTENSGHHEVIQMLIARHSAQFFEIRNKRRQNAFDLAVKNRSYVALRAMQQGRHPADAEIDADDKERFCRNPEGIARQTWRHDEGSWKNGVTTLMLTCRYHPAETRVEAVRSLLEANAAVDATTTKNKSTALFFAVDDINAELVELLLSHSANANHMDKTARTPLLQAAQSGSEEVAKLLLAHNADPLYKRKEERSILSYAAQYGYHRFVRILLDAAQGKMDANGVKLVDFTNEKGEESALTFAARYGHTKTCRMLIDEGIQLPQELVKPYWTSLHRACANGHSETAQLLLQREPRLLYHVKNDGFTTLMAAAFAGYTDMVMMLLTTDMQRKGSLASMKNTDGQSALWLAAAMGNEETVKVLVKHADSLMNEVVPGQEAVATADAWPESSVKVPSAFSIFQPTTAIMAAAYYGHTDCVRALHAAKADMSCFSEKDAKYDDALMIAARYGHKDIVRIFCSIKQARARVTEAEALATFTMTKTHDPERKQLFESIVEQLKKPELNKLRSRGRLIHGMGSSDCQQEAAEEKEEEMAERIRSHVSGLEWKRKVAFDGQLVPPRPREFELEAGKTPLGPIAVDTGLVIQFGPFNSIWLRAGCVPSVPWHQLWSTLRSYINVLVEDEKKKKRPGALYVVISLRSMQAIDFAWLADKGFQFHHYRAPGHGATSLTSQAPTAANREAVDVSDAAAGRPPSSSRAPAAYYEEAAASSEFVYYCWPGETMDMVPVYATSVEGATALVFSADETKLLMVWERAAWSTPGGAVNAGESKVDALCREVWEEVGVQLDRDWEKMAYLGGWQQEKARDNLVNDSFAAFAMRAMADDYQVDGKEIMTAHWFPWKKMLDAWIAEGRPMQKRVPFANFGALVGQPDLPDDRNVVLYNVMHWLETWASGRGYKVEMKPSLQGQYEVNKSLFNTRF